MLVYQKHQLDLTDLSADEYLYNLLNQLDELKADKNASKAADKLQEQIMHHIQVNHGDDIEWFFCREHEVTWKKSMGSRFQKAELLADEPTLAQKFLDYTKFFPRRTFTAKITKKSDSRWTSIKDAAS